MVVEPVSIFFIEMRWVMKVKRPAEKKNEKIKMPPAETGMGPSLPTILLPRPKPTSFVSFVLYQTKVLTVSFV